MRLVIINHSDTHGGAAIAMMRLMNALQAAGHDVSMIVSERGSTRSDVVLSGSSWTRRVAFLRERLDVMTANGWRRDTLFRVDPATRGIDVSAHPLVARADAILLGWVNQATLSLDDVDRLLATGKPVLWVMHDRWNMTGVCHVTGSCDRYTSQCGACPLLRGETIDLSTVTQGRKAMTYKASNLHFIAVSHWLMASARLSSLMRESDITVIPNAIDAKTYNPTRLNDAMWGDMGGKVVVAFGAARLDDPVKGLPLLAEASRYIAATSPALASRLHIVFYGGVRDSATLDTVALDHTYVGYVDDPRDVYRRSDIVLSTSEVESFGYTLLEGMACGCVPVTTGGGGQRDIVDHLVNGYVARSNAEDVARGLGWAADCRLERNALHRSALRFDAAVIARQYANLLNALVGSH